LKSQLKLKNHFHLRQPLELDGIQQISASKQRSFDFWEKIQVTPNYLFIFLHRLNDGSKTYMEANTLLEPANNSSAVQHDSEEIKEVSSQLSQIKKKHDEAKRACINK